MTERPTRRPTRPQPAIPRSVADEGIRLSKRVMADIGCSRTEAERLIEAGHVSVDGRVVRDIPSRVHTNQRVAVQGLGTPPPRPLPVTLLLNKPADVGHDRLAALLTEARHWPADRSGATLPHRIPDNLTPLEDAASGLVVWSQDPGVLRKLVDEGRLIEHELMADVRGEVSGQQLAWLQRPLAAPQRPPFHPVQASVSHSRLGQTRLRLVFAGYQPGWVLDLCQDAGLDLLALTRLRVGRIALKGLPSGLWRGRMGYERF